MVAFKILARVVDVTRRDEGLNHLVEVDGEVTELCPDSESSAALLPLLFAPRSDSNARLAERGHSGHSSVPRGTCRMQLVCYVRILSEASIRELTL